MASKFAEAFVRLFVKKDELKQGLDQAKKDTQGFAGQVGSIASKIGGYLAAAFTVQQVIAFGKAAIDAADRVKDLSDASGVSVEDISRMGYAASMSASDTESLATGLRYLGKSTGEAIKGSEEARRAFAAVGVSLSDLQTLSLRELFLEIADGFQNGSIKGSKAALAMQLFGKSGAQLVPLLKQGKVAITDLMREADRLGITISTQFAADAAEFNDNLATAKLQGQGVARVIAGPLLTALNSLMKYMSGTFAGSVDGTSKRFSVFAWTVKAASTVILGYIGLLRAGAAVGRFFVDAVTPGVSTKKAWADYYANLKAVKDETTKAYADIWDARKQAEAPTPDLPGGDDQSDKAAKMALQMKQQNLQLELQVAQMQGNVQKARELAQALDEVAAAQMRLDGASQASIAEFLKLSAQIRDEEDSQRQRAIYSAEADLGRQIVELTMSREASIRAIEEQAHRDRVMQLEDQYGKSVETDALIAQSHALMMAQLRNINADYGQDWDRLTERLAEKYMEEYRNIGAITERFAGEAHSLISDVLIEGIEGDLDGLKDAFKSFAKAVLREISNILASKAVAQLLSMLGSYGTTQALPAYSKTLSSIMTKNANGNVLRGGFRAFATGGIVTQPTLGLVGEGKYNEAVVPLPDGRAIPVDLQSVAESPIMVEVVWTADVAKAIAEAGAAEGVRRASKIVIPIVSDNLARNGELRRQFQINR